MLTKKQYSLLLLTCVSGLAMGQSNLYSSKDSYIDSSDNVYYSAPVAKTTSGNTGVIRTVKYDLNGNLIVADDYSLNTTWNHRVAQVKVDSSGNIYVAGDAYPTTNNEDIWFLIKYSSTGAMLWNVGYNTQAYVNGAVGGMDIDNNGNVYVVGKGNHALYTGYESRLLKFSASTGSLLVDQQIAPYQDTEISSVIFDSSRQLLDLGGVVGVSHTTTADTPYAGCFNLSLALAYTALGWSPSGTPVQLGGFCLDNSGNLLLACFTATNVTSNCVVEEFQQETAPERLGLSWSVYPTVDPVGVSVSPSGNMFLGGYSNTRSSFEIYRLSGNDTGPTFMYGTPQSSGTYQDTNYPTGLAVTPGGDAILAGSSYNSITGNYDLWVNLGYISSSGGSSFDYDFGNGTVGDGVLPGNPVVETTANSNVVYCTCQAQEVVNGSVVLVPAVVKINLLNTSTPVWAHFQPTDFWGNY
jgi:hypothetical protein